jgi:hypothetical protein
MLDEVETLYAARFGAFLPLSAPPTYVPGQRKAIEREPRVGFGRHLNHAVIITAPSVQGYLSDCLFPP